MRDEQLGAPETGIEKEEEDESQTIEGEGVEGMSYDIVLESGWIRFRVFIFLIHNK